MAAPVPVGIRGRRRARRAEERERVPGCRDRGFRVEFLPERDIDSRRGRSGDFDARSEIVDLVALAEVGAGRGACARAESDRAAVGTAPQHLSDKLGRRAPGIGEEDPRIVGGAVGGVLVYERHPKRLYGIARERHRGSEQRCNREKSRREPSRDGLHFHGTTDRRARDDP